MARIFICSDLSQAGVLDEAARRLRDRGDDVVRGPANAVGETKVYTAEERSALIDTADVAVFTVRHACSRELMAGARRLRGVCYTAIGVESLDLQAADDLGLIVGHGATRNNFVAMAEATIMLMLMLLYDVQTNIARMSAGLWRRPRPTGRLLDGKTVGLVGFGRISRAIAERLAPFNATVLTFSPSLRPQDLPPGVRQVSLETLLEQSDIVALLTTLTPRTRHMIGARELARMKPSAFLINTGRGALADEAALADALQARRIAGAALDTFEVEPLPADHAFQTLDNVILTPHAVGHTRDADDEFPVVLAENVRRILAGELPLHCKNPGTEPAWRARLAALEPA